MRLLFIFISIQMFVAQNVPILNLDFILCITDTHQKLFNDINVLGICQKSSNSLRIAIDIYSKSTEYYDWSALFLLESAKNLTRNSPKMSSKNRHVKSTKLLGC